MHHPSLHITDFPYLGVWVTHTYLSCHFKSVDGTSDDLDIPCRQIFNDSVFSKEHNVCSLNSINIARIIGKWGIHLCVWNFIFFTSRKRLVSWTSHHTTVQVIPFCYVYTKCLGRGSSDPVCFVCPTGAAGNITAGMLAKQMVRNMSPPLHIIATISKQFVYLYFSGTEYTTMRRGES